MFLWVRAPREIIVVNDGSRDSIRQTLDSLAGSGALLTTVHAEENRGKGYAVRLGFARARGTIVAIQDADLELDPEITTRLLLGGHRILERPVTFNPRSRSAGKKIGWADGVAALRTLIVARIRGSLPESGE